MVAIFALTCCSREIVFGRFRGDEMNPPKKNKCPFGCEPKLSLRGRPERVALRFLRYQGEDMLSDELRATDPVTCRQ
jgi:hypothetical protein